MSNSVTDLTINSRLLRAGEIATDYLAPSFADPCHITCLKAASYVLTLGILPLIAHYVRKSYNKMQWRNFHALERCTDGSLDNTLWVIKNLHKFRLTYDKRSLVTHLAKQIGTFNTDFNEQVLKDASLRDWLTTIRATPAESADALAVIAKIQAESIAKEKTPASIAPPPLAGRVHAEPVVNKANSSSPKAGEDRIAIIITPPEGEHVEPVHAQKEAKSKCASAPEAPKAPKLKERLETAKAEVTANYRTINIPEVVQRMKLLGKHTTELTSMVEGLMLKDAQAHVKSGKSIFKDQQVSPEWARLSHTAISQFYIDDYAKLRALRPVPMGEEDPLMRSFIKNAIINLKLSPSHLSLFLLLLKTTLKKLVKAELKEIAAYATQSNRTGRFHRVTPQTTS